MRFLYTFFFQSPHLAFERIPSRTGSLFKSRISRFMVELSSSFPIWPSTPRVHLREPFSLPRDFRWHLVGKCSWLILGGFWPRSVFLFQWENMYSFKSTSAFYLHALWGQRCYVESRTEKARIEISKQFPNNEDLLSSRPTPAINGIRPKPERPRTRPSFGQIRGKYESLEWLLSPKLPSEF